MKWSDPSLIIFAQLRSSPEMPPIQTVESADIFEG
jgi:hypothetical protein